MKYCMFCYNFNCVISILLLCEFFKYIFFLNLTFSDFEAILV